MRYTGGHRTSPFANNLSQKYQNVTFSPIIRRKDRPYLKDEVDVVNKKLYDICVSTGVEYIDNTNIVFFPTLVEKKFI